LDFNFHAVEISDVLTLRQNEEWQSQFTKIFMPYKFTSIENFLQVGKYR